MKPMSRILLVALTAASISTAAVAQDLTAAKTRAIAKEAYVYGYSIVDNWKAIYAFFYDPTNKLYKAPPNTPYCEASVYTPADTAIVTPNSDTPYCYVLMDLRAQPIVLQIPEVPSSRYYSVQLIDLYTYNFGYMGSRATGGKAGKYLVVGPSWKGAAPAGIAKVFRADTDLALD